MGTVTSAEPLFGYIKVELEETGQFYISEVWDMSGFLDSMIDNGETGEVFKISCVQMTEEEFNNLPEFTGF